MIAPASTRSEIDTAGMAHSLHDRVKRAQTGSHVREGSPQMSDALAAGRPGPEAAPGATDPTDRLPAEASAAPSRRGRTAIDYRWIDFNF
ncbi:hypothetical protein GCM10022225_69660 [Plantactinospora mayteni]|uniref:Uncharacterized protein n=1 Tax=Plantactinospora mayteni TaxID=566021 RepID=A0ABQ4EVX9_9ACTN|nr:hypothetical protein Pma05_53980 [Plantactinospora mayteni]